ncbi:MAG: hypothetical protein U0990_11565 [Candidatus Nanopelagicales bacterium]|nr:hypothetical protein [Candidatus Nanopelagicales bacterium]MDZ4250704.1 hypothetical protein [Candidatus Nanopelagicales bacterium]
MKRRTAVLAVSAASGLAVSLMALPAGAESSVSPTTLAGTVVKKSDLLPWFPKTKTVRAPGPGTGEDRIESQGICFKTSDKILSLNKLPKRQAWSDMRMGAPDTRGMLSLIVQYKTKAKAKERMQAVRAKLASCPAVIALAGEATITQGNAGLGSVYHGQGIGIYTTIDNVGTGPDSITYVAVRRTGRGLAFTRFSRMKAWAAGPPAAVPAKARSATEYLSVLVASRYNAVT